RADAPTLAVGKSKAAFPTSQPSEGDFAMKSNDIPRDGNATASDVGDRNIERLLGEVYKPEVPDPAFARRLTEQVCAAAREVAAGKAAPAPMPRPILRRLAIVMQAAAALAIVPLALQFMPREVPRSEPEQHADASAPASNPDVPQNLT